MSFLSRVRALEPRTGVWGMKVDIDKSGLEKTYQAEFPEEAKCECGGTARHAFTAHEQDEQGEDGEYVTEKHDNDPDGEGYWVHDACAVAVYFCRKCLKPVALMNQA